MEPINKRGIMQLETLNLGVQTSVGKTLANAILKARQWSPSKAKSFSFVLTHTDYHGHIQDHETGYASVKITYYSKVNEGRYVIKDEEDNQSN